MRKFKAQIRKMIWKWLHIDALQQATLEDLRRLRAVSELNASSSRHIDNRLDKFKDGIFELDRKLKETQDSIKAFTNTKTEENERV